MIRAFLRLRSNVLVRYPEAMTRRSLAWEPRDPAEPVARLYVTLPLRLEAEVDKLVAQMRTELGSRRVNKAKVMRAILEQYFEDGVAE